MTHGMKKYHIVVSASAKGEHYFSIGLIYRADGIKPKRIESTAAQQVVQTWPHVWKGKSENTAYFRALRQAERELEVLEN